MKTYYMNNEQPLPAEHHKAGQLGLTIDFEDGRPTQNVYASSHSDMTTKLAAMYGNTTRRLQEVKQSPPTPTTATVTPEQQMQATIDIASGDPARTPGAIITLVKAAGIDLQGDKANTAAKSELDRKREATEQFVANNPGFKPGPGGSLISERALVRFGVITTESLQKAYDSLLEDGVLTSAPMEQTPTTERSQPSATPTNQPSGTTSVRPSSFGSSARPTQTLAFTYEQVLEMAGTDSYGERLRSEPGFQEKVNAVVAAHEKTQKRA